MRPFDQLDWVHSFDDYEMFMYVRHEGQDDDGIYMQMLVRQRVDGAESWDIVYDRRLTAELADVSVPPDDPAYEDAVLRSYLNDHPAVVDEEKAFLAKWLAENSVEE
ncbi:hypothetical protein [Alicyclobacillus acidiphilus]|uniref:hypothetical protein n=1 Tax=Alicyclobacillus acidiphilus TaxID=182455 RepID=UPI000835BF0B|nr:hypothetical protein [Alicyclobacillus acidiphilus]